MNNLMVKGSSDFENVDKVTDNVEHEDMNKAGNVISTLLALLFEEVSECLRSISHNNKYLRWWICG